MSRHVLLTGIASLLAAAAPAIAQGEIYKCVDDTGRSAYTNIKRDTAGRNCQLVSREVSVVPAPAPGTAGSPSRAAATPSPASFPRVDAATQRSRDDGRRKILENELMNEEVLLSKAKLELSEQSQVRSGDERNFQKTMDRLQKYKDTVDQHEKNIAALRKELGSLK